MLIRTGTVVIVGPMVFSIEATGALRPDKVAPNKTTLQPEYWLTSSAHAARRIVESVIVDF